MYIGALVGEGEHKIVLKYVTPGLRTGGILTILGVIYLILLWKLDKKYCIKK
jgi:uncharacterized membrane protein YfhO